MSQYTQAQIVSALFRALPYPQHLSDLDLTAETEAVRFTWRGDQFRVSCYDAGTEQVQDGILAGNNIALLLEDLIKRELIAALMKRPAHA